MDNKRICSFCGKELMEGESVCGSCGFDDTIKSLQNEDKSSLYRNLFFVIAVLQAVFIICPLIQATSFWSRESYSFSVFNMQKMLDWFQDDIDLQPLVGWGAVLTIIAVIFSCCIIGCYVKNVDFQKIWGIGIWSAIVYLADAIMIIAYADKLTQLYSDVDAIRFEPTVSVYGNVVMSIILLIASIIYRSNQTSKQNVNDTV